MLLSRSVVEPWYPVSIKIVIDMGEVHEVGILADYDTARLFSLVIFLVGLKVVS